MPMRFIHWQVKLAAMNLFEQDILPLPDILDIENLERNRIARSSAHRLTWILRSLEQLFKTVKIVPAVNQVEMHPYLVDTELLEYCRKKGIVVTAYSPTGFQKLRGDPTIVGFAEKYKVTRTQIILAWHLARGVVAVPKSSNAERQKENLILPTLSAEDVASVTALDRKQRCDAWGKFGEDTKLLGWTAEQYGW
ncbi:NADP-dependent oxidoreductase domain-containing protein [Mycena capillaripes]|nr:NADP-dependent oxidoreductase domain-containing protein [Mycena capillaripes]